MNKDNKTVDARVAELEQTAAAHEQRLTALEKRLDPKERQRRMAADLDLLLEELAGPSRDEKEVE